MNKKDLLSLLFIIFFTITICLHGYFTDEFSTINLNRIAEEHVFNQSSIYDYNAQYFDEYLTNKSSSSVDKVQQDILDIENLKVPGTIAMAISESYPFKKNEIWNVSSIKKGEAITSYVFLANYKNESHDFLIFNLVNYMQNPSYFGGNLSTTHYLTLKKDSYMVFTLETKPFEQVGEHLLQVVAVIDPYKTEPTGKCGFLDTGYLYLSPKVLITVD